MKPTTFNGQTHELGKPQDWDEETQGKCETLPVMFSEYGIYSRWSFSFFERILILFGKPLTLIVASSSMPPVCLRITEPTEEK